MVPTKWQVHTEDTVNQVTKNAYAEEAVQNSVSRMVPATIEMVPASRTKRSGVARAGLA